MYVFTPSALSAAQRALCFLAIILGLNSPLSAIGIILPREPDAAAPQLQSVDVSAKVDNHVARTRFTQVFKNPNSRPVEADFYFPVPSGADITDFVLYMDGKPVKGEVLDKDKAHQIYRDIVRKMKDPGLVEWADKNLFRVRIFPIPANGEQKLEIEVSQPLTADQGYFRYFLPLGKSTHTKSPAPPLVNIEVALNAESPIRNVYSPTHKIDTDTSESRSVVVTADASLADSQSFVLYYEPTDKSIAASLLTHKTGEKDGYFSLRISPPWDETATSTASQGGDYVFVIDTSGSMTEGDKIQQARKALKYCISLLDDNDTFNLVRFSTTVEPYQAGLTPATPANRKSAAAWIDGLSARGGTNIADALKRALAMRDTAKTTGSAESMFTVVFLTDGLPTVGQTAPEAIIKAVEDQSGGNVRVFTFGVGHDVNTRLLDSIAEETRAASDYVAPEADLEVPVSRFFDKVNRPALFNVELQIPEAGVKEIYPAQLPDLFYGTELAIYGKYSKATSSPIVLTGTIGGEKKEFRFEKSFPAEAADNAFVEKLWATRKVAWLLDQMRKAGESKELKTEIEELAQKYSIVTPYTSYLAMEDKSAQDTASRRASTPQLAMQGPRHVQSSGRPASQAGDASRAAAPASMDLRQESGAFAVQTASKLREMKSADKIHAPALDGQEIRKTIIGKTFVRENDVWKDTAVTGTESVKVKIQNLSEIWFQISQEFPKIRDVFALGEQVIIQVTPELTLSVVTSVTDNIKVTDREKLFEGLKQIN